MIEARHSFDSFLEGFDRACEKANRKRSEIRLLPVSKGQSIEKIKDFLAVENFPTELAENYLEELEAKCKGLPQVRWHYQGAVQSRKISLIAASASVVQSVSRAKELELFVKEARMPNFFLQANISSEGQKLGASQRELKEMLDLIAKLNIEKHFCGFMGVASELGGDVSNLIVQKQFASLKDLRDSLAPKKSLSMGMSADYHLAIAEGSDLIRVGSSIFGARVYTNK